MRTATRTLAMCTWLLIAACGEEGTPVGPGVEPVGPTFAHIDPEAVCATIDFEAFEHGDHITSLPNLFGGAFSLTVTAVNNSNGPDVATAYDSDPPVGPDPDLENTADCPECSGIMAVLPAANFASSGDTDAGGIIRLTGFPTASAADDDGQAWIESYDGVDQDDNETAIELWIDGILRGSTTGQGDGVVEEVHAGAHPAIDDEVEFHFGGSGAIDNIVICFVPASPPPPPPPPACDGLTPGYWQNWGNHYSAAQFQELVDWVNTYTGGSLTIAQITAILGYGGNDAVERLRKFYFANLLTLALTDLDHLPNPDTAGLGDECVSSRFPDTTLGEALAAAEAIFANPGGFSKGQINAVKDVLDAIANLNN